MPGVIRRTTARRIGPLLVRVFGIFHLLDDGDAKAAADQAGEVKVGGVHRDPAHRDGGTGVFAAGRERDIEGGGGGGGVGEE